MTTNKGKKILKTPLRIAVCILLFGLMAKLLLWPYAEQTVLAGFILVSLLYSFRFIKKTQKQFLDYVKLVLIICWSANGILRMMHFPYTVFFQIVTGAAFITWFVMEGTAYFMDEDRHTKNSNVQIWWNVAMVLGTLSIIVGALMKLVHWQFAEVLLASGIIMVAFYILKDVFQVTKLEEKDTNNEEYQV
ncbi:GldL-related protein [Maribacter sp. 2-571]|uniref:GldL-related protein n=1 Tax=Maribacter sp. 2-571 TaxID=3417569 RepID=UPI003D32F96C